MWRMMKKRNGRKPVVILRIGIAGGWMPGREDSRPFSFKKQESLYVKNILSKISHIYSRRLRKEYEDEEMSHIKIY